MGKGSAALSGALLGLLLVPAAAEAELVRIIAPPNRPDQYYFVPRDVIGSDHANQREVRRKLQAPARSWWGPRNVTAGPADTGGSQWFIFPVCNGQVTAPGKFVDRTDVTAVLRCP